MRQATPWIRSAGNAFAGGFTVTSANGMPLEDAMQDIAVRFDLAQDTRKGSLHRLRERYREAIRRDAAETVSSEAEIDAEIAARRETVSG